LNKPSEEIKKAAEEVGVFRDTNHENMVEWLRIIAKMPYQAGFTNSNFIDSLKDPKLYVDEYIEPGSTFLNFHIDLTPELPGDDTCMLAITFNEDFSASIAPQPFTAPESDVPDYLIEISKDILGFKGTWEEVIKKWIELQNAIANHKIPEVFPPVPESMK